MIKPAKLKVKLISHTKDPEQIVVAAIRQCYSAVGADALKRKTNEEMRARLIKQVISSGHTSTLEHASFTFAIEGVSRVTEIHLIRHRIASYSIQSGRYVKRGEASYRIPQTIEGLRKRLPKLYHRYEKLLDDAQSLYNDLTNNNIPAQDARYCQPKSLQTKIVVTMNARALLHFFELRCCKRAQWEIRELADKMLQEVKRVAPTIFTIAGPTCITQKICWEGKLSCGQYKTIKGAELRER